ncbi:MAG TPA: M91 family zinc metallopeptidase [Bryobacteraceae bacterium]|jgi:hypothetical protein
MQVFRNSIWVDGAHIWRWNGHRWLHRPAGGHPAAYENDVLRLLSQIYGNPAGRLLLNAIQTWQHGKVQIVPYRGEDGARNASATAWDFRGATPQGETELDTNGTVWHVHHPERGTGGGSSVFVRYSPGTWTHGHHAGDHQDEVLFHELTHAYRDVRGHALLRGTDSDYPNQEEFWATLNTNIYISAKGAGLPLRGSYNHARDVQDRADAYILDLDGTTRLTESQALIVNYRNLVGRLFDEERPLTEPMSGVRSTYNPYRDYIRMTGIRSLFAEHADNWH